MAVTMTAVELAAALRLGDSAEELAEVTRMLGYATEAVVQYAPLASDVAHTEAARRLCGYLYDQPEAGRGDAYSNALRNSGAGRMLLPFRVHRAGAASDGDLAAAQTAVGSVGNPVIGLDIQAGQLVVTFADGTTDTLDLPAGMGVDGLDQTARDSAAQAAQDVIDHNAANDSHEDIRTAIAGRVDQNQVEQTAQRLIDSAGHASNTEIVAATDAIARNATALTTHEGTPHGGSGGESATPTPPVVLVDAELFTAYGDITIPGWRGYDFIQLLFTNGADTFQSEPVNSARLIALSPVIVSMSRNVGWRLTIDASDDDVITIATTGGNTIAAPTATSTMTVIAWFAGTVVGEGSGTVDQTARDTAIAHAANANAHHTPPVVGEVGTVDQTARDTAVAHAADANAHHTPPVGEGGEAGDDAYDWATVGNDPLLVPTDKINFSSVQNQLDDIVDQIAHSAGTITAVVPTVGSGQDSLRYTLPNNLNGQYDVSVRVKARVQINEFANISGNLHIIEDGGNGLNAAIPEKTHNLHHAHDGVVNFIRKGLTIALGVNQIDFRALVTGQNPPDVHFVELENLTLTDTSLVNAGNVNPFIADWAEAGNTDPVPDAKLTEVRSWARASAHGTDYPFAQQLGGFNPFDIAEIPNGEDQKFFYHAVVQRDPDATLAYVGGSWAKEVLGGGAPAAFEDPLILETDLTTDYLTVLTIPSQSLTAGKKYRVTSTTFARAIGDAHHTLYVRLFLGTDIIVTAQTAIDPEGSSQGRWAMTVDKIVTMPTPAVTISVGYAETTASFVRVLVPSTLIVQEVS